MAETFIPKIKGKDVLNHIDGNKLNNNLSNLEWCTYSENTIHAFQNELINHYSRCIKCLEKNDVFDSIKLAAQWCGCKTGTIKDFLNRPEKHRNFAGKHPITKQQLHWCYC